MTKRRWGFNPRPKKPSDPIPDLMTGDIEFWRQVETRRTVKRTQFKAHKHQYLGEKRAREKAHPANGANT